MGKFSLALGCTLLFFCLSLPAQRDVLGGSLHSLTRGQAEIPGLSLGNAQRFSFPSTLVWINTGAAEFLPPLAPAAPQRNSVAAVRLPDSSKGGVDLAERNFLNYMHGEIGVLYGHSIGKSDGDVEAGYILGEVGDDKLQISVGGSYEHWSGRVPRFGR